MALALSLVGQPVQPYLTTGATDFVNSVQKGKEDAIRTEGLKTQSQKSALDLLTAQKKQKESEWVSANASTVLQKAKKMEMSDAEYTRMLQADPEFGKLLGTEQADAVKNYTAANLAYLNSSQDKVKALQEINQADDNYKVSMPENVRNDPNLALQHLKTRVLGAKAFEEKTAVKNEAGDVETRDSFGNVISINPAAVKAEKTQKAPVTWTVANGRKETTYGYDANGKQIVLGVKNLDAPKTTEEPTPEFTEAAINNAAARYNIDGTLPPMGMGKGGATARSLILNRAAVLAGDTSGTDQRVAQLTTKASASTLLQLKKTKTMIKAFEEMANKNADIALELSTKVDRSGTPVVNRWFLAANNKIAGDVDTATFNTAVNVFANEYAKIMSGSMGNTPVSDSARKEAHEILNTAQTPAQLRANIKLLQREMQNRIKGLDDSERELLKGMRGSSSDAKKDEGKNPTGNQGAYQLYVQHWNAAKNNPALQKKLTDRAREMGIVK